MSLGEKILLLEGHGGGDILIIGSEVAMAWDISDAKVGKYCNVLLKHGGQARVTITAKQFHRELTSNLTVAEEAPVVKTIIPGTKG